MVSWLVTQPCCWVQAYVAMLKQRIRKHLRPCAGSWRVDETCIEVQGVWICLYWPGHDFPFSVRRKAATAKHFLRKALKQPSW